MGEFGVVVVLDRLQLQLQHFAAGAPGLVLYDVGNPGLAQLQHFGDDQAPL